MRTRRSLLALCLALTLTSCTKLPPDTSVEAKFAVRGRQVAAALRAAGASVKPMVCQPNIAMPPPVPTCLTAADADKVFAILEKAGEYGEQLGPVLIAVDDAKDAVGRQAGLAKAGAIVRSIQQSLAQAQVTPGNQPARDALVQLLQTVTGLLFAIGGL